MLDINYLKNAGFLKKASQIKKENVLPIDKVIDGILQKTPYGEIFSVPYEYPMNFDVNGMKISDIGRFFNNPLLFSTIGKDQRLSKLSLDRLLFVDIETTGLSGGSGTLIFLFGIGYFTENSFRIVQYFLRDYNEELAALHILSELFIKYDHIISFNGKCFDIQLIKSKFDMSRKFKIDFDRMLHFDLLHSSRRIWKTILNDCSLKNIEEKIMNLKRPFKDIPGELIPIYYFRYLKNRDPEPLKVIFYHNQQDILSLLILLITQLKIFENPLEYKNIVDYYRLGKIYEDIGSIKDCIRLYGIAKSIGGSYFNSLVRLSFVYKRINEWEHALECWNELKNYNEIFSVTPYEELAKYYEHRIGDLEKAKSVCEECIKKIQNQKLLYGRNITSNETAINHRHSRLADKISKKYNKN